MERIGACLFIISFVGKNRGRKKRRKRERGRRLLVVFIFFFFRGVKENKFFGIKNSHARLLFHFLGFFHQSTQVSSPVLPFGPTSQITLKTNFSILTYLLLIYSCCCCAE